MTEQKKRIWNGVTMPLWIFQCPFFSINTRVLLAYIKFMDRNHFSFPSANRVCVLLGLVDEEGVPTEKNIKSVRQARQQLIKKGALTHFRTANAYGESKHRWRVNGDAVSDTCLAMMNASAPSNVKFVQRWASEPNGDGAPTPSRATPPTPKGLPPVEPKSDAPSCKGAGIDISRIARDEDNQPSMDMSHLMRSAHTQQNQYTKPVLAPEPTPIDIWERAATIPNDVNIDDLL